jgi:hypothetical protein
MNKLTTKRKMFINEYIKTNGNGTQSALRVYDNKTAKGASVTATRVLADVSVQEELNRRLLKEDAKVGKVVDNIASIAVETPIKGYSGADILEANKTLLKLHGVLTDRKVTTTYNLNADLNKLSKYELIERHKKTTKETQDILDGEEA